LGVAHRAVVETDVAVPPLLEARQLPGPLPRRPVAPTLRDLQPHGQLRPPPS
jgi:hypothetical protein